MAVNKQGAPNAYFESKRQIEAEKASNSLLYNACAAGDFKSVVRLCEAGENMNRTGEKGQSPLIAACEFRRSAVAKYLIDNGANVNLKSKTGKTALHKASYNGLIPIMKLLVNKGASVNERESNYFNTPLHVACEYDQKESAGFLVSLGADTTLKNNVCIGNPSSYFDNNMSYQKLTFC